MSKGKDITVSVLCQTYNHEEYIAECLQSLVSQKVNFHYEILVHDDASTDNTANIVRQFEKEYPEIIKPIYQKVNQWSLGNKVFTGIQLPRCTGKYIAVCEGDDYWTDLFKLQKQVDLLESEEGIGLVYTKARVFIQETKQFASYLVGKERTSLDSLILKGNAIPTLTAMWKREIMEEYLSIFTQSMQKWKMADYPLWIYIVGKYKVAFLNEVTGVYRVLSNSASHQVSCKKNIKFTRCYFEISSFFVDYFNLDAKFHQIIKQGYISYVAKTCIQKQYKEHVIYRYLCRYSKVDNIKIFILKTLTMSSLGRGIIRYLLNKK